MSNVIPLACGLIRGFESLRLHAYPDPGTGGEPWTVGYGATGKGIGPDTVWTREQAEADLERRVTELAAQVSQLVHVQLPDDAVAALISFAYNVGVHALASSHLLIYVNQRAFKQAGDAFLSWTHGGGRELPGLVARRKDERAHFLNAIFPPAPAVA